MSITKQITNRYIFGNNLDNSASPSPNARPRAHENRDNILDDSDVSISASSFLSDSLDEANDVVNHAGATLGSRSNSVSTGTVNPLCALMPTPLI